VAEAETAQARFRRAVAGATAAIAAHPSLKVSFGSDVPSVAGSEVRLPPVGRRFSAREVAQLRGAADSMALRLRFHDQAVHAAAAPSNHDARDAFDACEQARVEALGTLRMHGVAANLDSHVTQSIRTEGFDRPVRREDVPLPWALRILLRERITAHPVPEVARLLANLWRPWLEERAGDSFTDLAAAASDQAASAEAARAFLVDLGFPIDSPDDRETSEGDEPEPEEESGAPGPSGGTSGDLAEPLTGLDSGTRGVPEGAEDAAGPAEPRGIDRSDESGGPAETRWPDNAPLGEDFRYHAFTTKFDEVADAAELCDVEELQRLRLNLDQQLQQFQNVVSRLANRLQRLLLAKQVRSWEFDLDEGVVDSARLARIVANPENPLSYKREKEADFRDTVVSLLLDNSGSMRGRPITVSALCADILSRTLERCGVKTEILGFTTKAWKGGHSRDLWVAESKPADPGRLNDLLHIVYKGADEPLRRARRKFGLMLRDGLLKENIDGEALAWAHRRLLSRPEERRILMVISDGAPVDDSTLSANSGDFLDRHLRSVIDAIETRSPVELVAIGIGHDVTRYYRRAITLVDTEQLGGAIMTQLADLFDESRGPRSVH
jgi:cobaltochelatase CobT